MADLYLPYVLMFLLAFVLLLTTVIVAIWFVRTMARIDRSLQDIAARLDTATGIIGSISFPEALLLLRDLGARVTAVEQAIRDAYSRHAT